MPDQSSAEMQPHNGQMKSVTPEASPPFKTSNGLEKVGLYKGESGKYLGRGIKAYEAEWNQEKEVGQYSFDKLVLEAVDNAAKQGRQDVTIFDFGCGEGNLFREFIATGETSDALQYINEHPELQVHLVGLTDTSGLQDVTKDTKLFTQLPIPNEATTPPNLEAHRVVYSLTAAQPLEDFLIHEGITTIDLAIATQSFPYLSTKNFSAVLQTITDHLAEDGGRMIAAPYATRVPGFRGGAFGEPTPIIGNTSAEPSLPATLRDERWRFTETANIPEETTYLQKALDKYTQLGVLTPEEVTKKMSEELPRKVRMQNFFTRTYPTLSQITEHSPDARKSLMYVATLLSDARMNLGFKKLEEIGKQKRAALQEFQATNAGRAEIKFGKDVIDIRKGTVNNQ